MINFQVDKLWNPKPVLETTEKNMELFQFKRARVAPYTQEWAPYTRMFVSSMIAGRVQVSYNKTKKPGNFQNTWS